MVKIIFLLSKFIYFSFIIFLSLFMQFFSFIIIFFFSSLMGKKGIKSIAFVNSFYPFWISIILLLNALIAGRIYYITCCYWINIGILNVYWSFTIDLVTTIMMSIVYLVAFLVIIFSFDYMGNDPFFSRFISLLSIFSFFMIFFVSSDNFIQFFLGWEGIGLCSYFLINFWFSRIQATKSAFKALLINRVGDVCLLASFSIIFLLYGTLDFSILNVLIPFFQEEFFFLSFLKINLLYLISFFLFIGVLSKSAQIGLHTWLPDAMEGPTPVSALIHAATMVTAGVYLLIRISFIFEFVPEFLKVISLIGAFTAFFSATIALAQMDIKKLIAYSTCSQLGYMVFACGMSLYNLSLFHLFNHAFFKALLFLSAGSIIHSLFNEQDFRKMGGLLKILPTSYICILIASLSLCGFPFLSGFFSKDIIIEYSILGFKLENIFCFWLVYLCAFLTALYSVKLVFLVFLNKFNFYINKRNFIYDSSSNIYISQFFLVILSIFSGYLFKEFFIGSSNFFMYNAIFELPKSLSFFEIECFYEVFYFFNLGFFYLILIKYLPLYFSFFSIIIYYYYFLFSYKIIFYNFFFKYSKFFFFFSNKWYIDYFYCNFIIKPFLLINFNIFINYFDKGLIEFFGPSSILLNILKFNRFFNKIQFNFISNFLTLIIFFGFLLVFTVYFIYLIY